MQLVKAQWQLGPLSHTLPAGGSILSTRCSETYETKTALISLFGIPLWYYSQSPRVVIQVRQPALAWGWGQLNNTMPLDWVAQSHTGAELSSGDPITDGGRCHAEV